MDGLVSDEPVAELPTLQTELLMSDAPGRARLAGETLAFAAKIAATK